MLKPYLFAYNNSGSTKSELLNYIDTIPEIVNWYDALPHTIFLISDKDSNWLSEKIRIKFKEKLFIITEIKVNHNGLLYEDVWDFINNPKSA